MQIVLIVNNETELEELMTQAEHVGATVLSKSDSFPKYYQGAAGCQLIEIDPGTSADWICGGIVTIENS